jgi:thiol:disulfide interchange protein DsbD
MESVKSVLGIALLALAALYVKDAFGPARGALAGAAAEVGRVPGAWVAGVVAALGIALGAIHLSFKAQTSEVMRKAFTVALVVAALLLRAGALNAPPQGGLWVRLGLSHAEHKELVWDFQYPRDGATVEKFDRVLAEARADHRPVMIDFGADWCAACKELDRETYVAADVVQASRCFTNIKVDGTDEGDEVEALYKRYGIQGLPTVLFVSGDGRVLDSPRVLGFQRSGPFVAQMEKVRGLTPGLSVCSR